MPQGAGCLWTNRYIKTLLLLRALGLLVRLFFWQMIYLNIAQGSFVWTVHHQSPLVLYNEGKEYGQYQTLWSRIKIVFLGSINVKVIVKSNNLKRTIQMMKTRHLWDIFKLYVHITNEILIVANTHSIMC